MKSLIYVYRANGDINGLLAKRILNRREALRNFAEANSFEFVDLNASIASISRQSLFLTGEGDKPGSRDDDGELSQAGDTSSSAGTNTLQRLVELGTRSISPVSDAQIFDFVKHFRIDRLIEGACLVVDNVRCIDFTDQHNDRSATERASWAVGLRQEANFCRRIILGLPFVHPVFIHGESDYAGEGDWPGDLNPLEEMTSTVARAWGPLSERGADDEANRRAVSDFVRELQSYHLLPWYALVSSRDSLGTLPPFKCFVEGYSSLFDPTGLRSFFKFDQLCRAFKPKDAYKGASEDDGRSIATLRHIAERIRHVATVVDEEASACDVSGYSLYRHGRRAFTVNSEETLLHGQWRDNNAWRPEVLAGSALILRDLDLQFFDKKYGRNLENLAAWELARGAAGPTGRADGQGASLQNAWRRHAVVRAVSSSDRVVSLEDSKGTSGFDVQTGESLRAIGPQKEQLLGVRKPILTTLFVSSQIRDDFQAFHSGPSSSLHVSAEDAKRLLRTDKKLKAAGVPTARCTMLARLDLTDTRLVSRSHHAAPPLNFLLATQLIEFCHTLAAAHSPRAAVLGAVAAHEAYELLMGRSIGTAVEAFELLQKFEVMIETKYPIFPGDLDLVPRMQEIDLVLTGLFGFQKKSNSVAENFYSAKIWNAMRSLYAGTNHFSSADTSNLEVLINQPWFHTRSFLQNFSPPFSLDPIRRLLGRRHFPRLKYDSSTARFRRVLNRKLSDALVRVRHKGYRIEGLKRFLVPIVTRPRRWMMAFLVFCVVSFGMFAWHWISDYVNKDGPTLSFAEITGALGNILELVLLGSLGDTNSRDTFEVGGIVWSAPWWLLAPFLFINVSLMGAFIAIILRLVTRD